MKTSARIAGLFVALVAGVLLAVAPATAQVLYGTVVGTVTDPTGAAIPKASVTVVNTATGLSRQVTTDETGYFSVPNLLQGTYDITVSASGFKPFTRRGVSVLTNTVTRVDATLEVGAITESITVEATAALLQTTKTDVSVNLEPRALVNLPLAAYRNYQMLINLVPGATPARFQNAVIDTPGRALTTNINGQERGANNTRLDGAANILVTMPHHVVYVPPVESIQEVNISTNSFEAEQGMTGGAAVTVVTKSGTNEFHGSLFGMHQDNAMRAFLWDERRVGVTRKPKNIRNILGGSLGGPDQEEPVVFLRGLGRRVRARGPLAAAFRIPRRLPPGRLYPQAGRADFRCRRQADHGPHHRGWLYPIARRNDFRSLYGQSGRHGPGGVLLQRAHQRDSAEPSEPGDEEAARPGADAQPAGRPQ
jgi:hypothetical protein